MKKLIPLLTILFILFSIPTFSLAWDNSHQETLDYLEQRKQTRTMKKSLALQEEAMERAEEQRQKDRYRKDLDDARKAFGY